MPEDTKATPPLESGTPVVPVGGDVTRQHAAAAALKGGTGSAAAPADDAKGGQALEPKTVEIGDDTYDLNEKGQILISAQAFKRRLGRYTKQELKAAFGTDDIDDLKARLDEHGKLKAKSDEERRKTLAKEEQLSEDLKAAREEAAAAKARAAELEDEREIRDAEAEVREVAGNYVRNAKCAKLASEEFREYMQELDAAEASKLKGKDLHAWFKTWAADNPDFAKPTGDGKDKHEPERRPANIGAGDDRGAKPPPAAAGSGKTAKPNQPNSMTGDEYRVLLKNMGINP